jgi:hypothetical protein
MRSFVVCDSLLLGREGGFACEALQRVVGFEVSLGLFLGVELLLAEAAGELLLVRGRLRWRRSRSSRRRCGGVSRGGLCFRFLLSAAFSFFGGAFRFFVGVFRFGGRVQLFELLLNQRVN